MAREEPAGFGGGGKAAGGTGRGKGVVGERRAGEEEEGSARLKLETTGVGF